MYFPRESIKLIRYLCVWRVNGSLVHLPNGLATELARVLAELIAARMPTQAASAWHKQLNAWREYQISLHNPQQKTLPIPETLWPLQAVFLPYPGKRSYGREELIFWELKLLGSSADHAFFLEAILPAMEEAGYTSDPRWKRHNSLWGRFDIDAVYIAKGPCWEPLAEAGRLNLHCRATPAQWTENHDDTSQQTPRTRLRWITPVDLNRAKILKPQFSTDEEIQEKNMENELGGEPLLTDVLNALTARLTQVLSMRNHLALEDFLNPEQQERLQTAFTLASGLLPQSHTLISAPSKQPGSLIGTQNFMPIPPDLLPYLDLAAILHIGAHTQFGCGTFVLT
ncbi:MAG: hypothetical protein GY862_12115 [Gammaproteobacteria bacterium]|nr:hypothetical protein [Gammaproteobacteria bacterium]